MKKRKSDTSKPTKKKVKKAEKKELQSGIAERLLTAINLLGHDAERLAKDIKKMSKQIAEKLSDRIEKVKETEKKEEKKKVKKVKEPEKKGLKKSINKAEKVVAKVAAVKEPAQATTTDKVSNLPDSEGTSLPAKRGRRKVVPEEAQAPAVQPARRRRGRAAASAVEAEPAKAPAASRTPRRRKAAPAEDVKPPAAEGNQGDETT
ncbi:hypothetical protein [Pedobacter sp. SYSU D00535]|uniref:hypothetical protein n=1 Tax=Pedobacter sp. SYSU D00535 TaxID=2810308 RepID=UPI001A95D78D|nr:hypothetical protein [Pedobacter sp. SYSU D00535]